jgi:hypothetical protein
LARRLDAQVIALEFRSGEIEEHLRLSARWRLKTDLGTGRLLVATVGDEHLRRARCGTLKP